MYFIILILIIVLIYEIKNVKIVLIKGNIVLFM